jgi:hypothetical protein
LLDFGIGDQQNIPNILIRVAFARGFWGERGAGGFDAFL